MQLSQANVDEKGNLPAFLLDQFVLIIADTLFKADIDSATIVLLG
jgi:hypothetical protein